MIASKLKINYIPEFIALIFGRGRPLMVSVNITNKCNQHCVYCEIGATVAKKSEMDLSKDDLFWIIDQMKIQGIKRLSINGGEPFLFKDLIEVVVYAHQNSIQCNITSNGMIISQLSEQSLQLLKDCKTLINISVDSFQEKIQSQTRGVETALSHAIKSIQLLQSKDIPVTVLSAISKYNYHELFDSLIKARKYGVRQILYQPIIYFSNFTDKDAIEQKSDFNVSRDKLPVLMEQLRKILAYEKSHRINTNVYRIMPWILQYIESARLSNGTFFFDSLLKKFYCREAFAVIDISYFGEVQACGLLGTDVNIRDSKERGLLALWKEASGPLQSDILKTKFPPACNGCSHKFSRNMFASVFKHPIDNRCALMQIIPLLLNRMISRLRKKIIIKD